MKHSPSCRRHLIMLARVSFCAILVILVALFLSYYLDTPVPEEIPEKFRVKVIDAFMRTYRHLMNGLVKLGVTDYFSPLDRKISDWFILTQMTGTPWGMSTSADQTLKINDTYLDGVRVKIYEPVATIRSYERPAFIFLHGGGWSLMSVDSYDPLVQKLARESGTVIISVDFRLSPQYPYPVPLEDSTRVVNYVVDHATEMQIDPYRVAVGGDSAGGNMAASIALRHRDKLAMQFLIVPCLQMLDFQTTSFTENTQYFRDSINSPDSLVFLTNYLGINPTFSIDFLTNNHTSLALKQSHYSSFVNRSRWIKQEYVRDTSLLGVRYDTQTSVNEQLANKIEKLITDPFVAPLMANDSFLKNMPEAYIVTCGYDFIRDDGIMYAARLKSAGTKVVHKHYKDGFHHAWFFPHGPLRVEVGAKIVSDLIKALSTRL